MSTPYYRGPAAEIKLIKHQLLKIYFISNFSLSVFNVTQGLFASWPFMKAPQSSFCGILSVYFNLAQHYVQYYMVWIFRDLFSRVSLCCRAPVCPQTSWQSVG